MKAFFSKRHEEAIFEKRLRPSFSSNCRVSIKRILEKYSNRGGLDGLENLTFDGAEADLKTFYGVTVLKAFDSNNKYVPASLSEVILNDYPTHVLDVIEAWFYQKPEQAMPCEKELNEILPIHNSPWRIVNGEAMLVDSEYLHREVRAQTIKLLEKCDIQGALEEYQDAVSDLISGETKDAVVKAHKSVESVMKAVLETDEAHTYGTLLGALIKSEIIPKYYEEFLKHFEKLALGVVKERNLPARGHGQGRKTTQVSHSLAEFAVNLAGAINVFILKHWTEKKGTVNEDTVIQPEDIPFELSPEDDIPFQ